MVQIQRQGISYRDVREVGEQTKAGTNTETSNSGKLLPSGVKGKGTVSLEPNENWNCGEGSSPGSQGGIQLLPEM